MSVFCHYANYYDLLYKDKDYEAEANHVDEILQRYLPGNQSILELGCGTGAHAEHLIKKGYDIHGVDVSEAMLARAEENKNKLDPFLSGHLSFSIGDIRNVRLKNTYDAAISLFHVISYLPENDDIQAVLSTVKSQVRKGGIFLFDCWYGPAVLNQKPEVREKQFEDDRYKIIRRAEPKMIANANIVEVNYQLLAEDKENGRVEKIEETHRMRYLFKPEIEIFFSSAGIQFVDFFEWMTGREPGLDSWSVCFIGRMSE
jgi:SAM-dependent methyltransferase